MQHRTVLVLVRELGQVEQAPVQEQEVQELALGQVELGQEPELAQELVVQELAQEPVEQVTKWFRDVSLESGFKVIHSVK